MISLICPILKNNDHTSHQFYYSGMIKPGIEAANVKLVYFCVGSRISTQYLQAIPQGIYKTEIKLANVQRALTIWGSLTQNGRSSYIQQQAQDFLFCFLLVWCISRAYRGLWQGSLQSMFKKSQDGDYKVSPIFMYVTHVTHIKRRQSFDHSFVATIFTFF